MDNCIATLQNTPKMLRCLAAQRKRYTQAKWYRGIGIILSLIGIILSYVITNINGDKLSAILGLITVAMTLCSLILTYIAQHLQKQAASIQQYFDVTLFSKALGKERDIWGDLLPDQDINSITSSVREKDMKGVENWYHCTQTASVRQQVFLWQTENIRWSDKLYQWAVVSFCALALLFLVIGFCFAIQQDILVTKLFCTLSWFLVPWGHFCVACVELTKTWMAWKSLNAKSNAIWQTRKQIDENAFIQKLINLQHGIREMRETCFLLPDWFYKFFRKRFENHETQLAQNLQEEDSEDHRPPSPSAS